MTYLLGGAGVLAAVALARGLHRLCRHLEELGYLYYRKRGGGGAGASILMEIDKVARPSVEHVLELQASQTKVAPKKNLD